MVWLDEDKKNKKSKKSKKNKKQKRQDSMDLRPDLTMGLKGDAWDRKVPLVWCARGSQP